MDEYIEREALMSRIKEIHCAECDSYNGVRCRACLVDDTLGYIDSEPAADVAPVRHGRWIPFHSEAAGDIQYCSVCEIGFAAKTVYCPHCGANMDGGNDD